MRKFPSIMKNKNKKKKQEKRKRRKEKRPADELTQERASRQFGLYTSLKFSFL